VIPQKTHFFSFNHSKLSFFLNLDEVMSHFRRLSLSMLILSATHAAHAEHVALPSLSVEGLSGESVPYALPSLPLATTDTGDLVKKLPGANINANGPLTPIVQYRGMYGDRVNVLVDGMHISMAGPNSMDSPLSHIPASQVSSVSLYRGIAPVSSGMETIGGSVLAESKQAEFADSDAFEFHGNTSAGYASNGNSRYASVLASEANDTHRFDVAASTDRGNNQAFADGDIKPTEFKRDTLSLGYGLQAAGHFLDVNIKHHDTGATGTPALPMDIIYARGETYRLNLAKELNNGGTLRSKLHYQDADHLMNNYALRPPLDPAKLRYNYAEVQAHGFSLGYEQGAWSLGIDTDRSSHNSTIYNPDSAAFFMDNFHDVQRDRYSAFAEWNGELEHHLTLETGARLTRVNTNAGEVYSSMMGGMATLSSNFNQASRKQGDTLVDLVAKLTKSINHDLDLEIGLARKQRAPSYQERYLWAPMESTGGLADGRVYVGDINLKPETAYQLELGLDWHTPQSGISPRVFYHRVNDYIQGVTSSNTQVNMVAKMMNPAAGTPLQFSNVDAELYGIDTNWYYTLSSDWQLDGTVSYVRGKRRDVSDNLYRIAPLTTRTMLSYVQPMWRSSIELVAVASQRQVSAENLEEKTAGYALINLSTAYQAAKNMTLTAGINNVFDRDYANHLNGYYRIKDSYNADIAQGERIPGLGRSLFAGINYNW
jgi:iron complex outermembrane receptor protein